MKNGVRIIIVISHAFQITPRDFDRQLVRDNAG
jgi:hypothetical protein